MNLLTRKNMMRTAAVAAACTLSLSAVAAFKDYGGSTVRFTATGPGGLNINGKGGKVEVVEKGGVMLVSTRVDKLKTGISLRDSHLKKYLNASKHRIASLKVKRSSLKMPKSGGKVSASAKGMFKLNGVTKPTTFTYQAKRKGNKYKVRGFATIDITDHNIKQPCYLGVCVDTKVKVKVSFKVEDK